ncbi:Nephrin [Folsomia candida]|uniref:Nephrin n=2 Tax=Folsomia candida TaxID=158441 RepID=A0A226ERW7_FOLCA|nr:Nephrin [Folsomia candida]
MDAGNVTQSTFLFVPTPRDNGARITCRAENPWLNRSTAPYNVLEESWIINVVYLPEVKLSLGSTLNPQFVKEGTDLYFECHIRASPPYTRIRWFFQEDELKHTPTAGIIMSNQSLVLQGITRTARGNYTCQASNMVGTTVSNIFPLDVQYAPVCKSEMGVTVGAVKGEHIGLRCGVDASPVALRFEWEFHGAGESVDVVPAGRAVSQGDLSRFLYSPTHDSEFGTFLCWATNDIGRQVQPCLFHVVAAVKPHPLENCTVVNQTTTIIHIECSAHRELPQIPDQPLFRIMHGDTDASQPNQDPAQYGLFPEYYVMEVWDLKNRSIRKNLSAETPVFILKGLAPGSLLRLVLYAANSHGKSEPHVIEAIVAGDAEKHMLGASTSRMEFFPLAAVGIGMAIVGTVLLLFLVMLFRTRLTNANSRTMRTQPANNANNSHHHPLEKPNSLILTSGLTTTSATNNSSSTNTTSNMNSGYRALPQSKAEADAANPDIIPGANGKNFPATKDYKDELQRTLSLRKGGAFIPASSPLENGQSSSSPMQGNNNANNTLPRPRPPPGLGNTSGGSGVAGNGSFHHHPPQNQTGSQHHQQQQHNQLQYQTLKNYVKDYPPPHYHHSPIPANDYNTIYIRDKLLHDVDIPESCV